MQIDDPHASHAAEHSTLHAPGRVALIDADEARRRALRAWLDARGYLVVERAPVEELPPDIARDCDVVFVGHVAESPDHARRVVAALPDVPVVVVTAADCDRDAVIAWMRAGVADVLVAPRSAEELADVIERATRNGAHAAPDAETSAACFCQAEKGVLPFIELERRALQHALRAAGDSVGKAARMLGIGRTTMYRKIAELDLVRPPR